MRRLDALAPLDAAARAALLNAGERYRTAPPRFELLREGKPIVAASLILEGWAARLRLLADGRRQIMSFLLPGDLIGNCRHERPLAVSTVSALTELRYCAAPLAIDSDQLAKAYAMSHALEEAHLLAHITRLGQLSAEDRIADLFLELQDRLSLCGLVGNRGFAFPLTQEMLADALGLTPVHTNRTLQLLRRHGDISLRSGILSIVHPARLAERVGHLEAQVSCGGPVGGS